MTRTAETASGIGGENPRPGYAVPALAAVAMAGIALRAVGLTRWSLHPDELLMGKNVLSLVSDPNEEYWLMPLSHMAVHPFLLAFGLDELGLRAGSFVLGGASLGVFAWGMLRFFGPTAALIATTLLAVSSWHIYFSQYARFYATAFFFCTVYAFALIGLLERPGRRWVALSGIAGACCLYAHTYGILAVAAGLSAAFVLSLAQAGGASRAWLRPIVASGAVTFVLALPAAWMLVKIAPVWSGAQEWGYSPAHTAMGIVNNATLPVVLAAGLGLLGLRARGDWRAWLIAGVAVLPAVALAAASSRVSVRQDYYFACSAGLFALAALGIEALARDRRAAYALAGLVALMQAPNLVSYYSCGNRFQYREAAGWLAGRIGQDDVVVSGASGLLSFYGVPEGQTESSRRPETLAGGGEVWVVVPVSRSGAADVAAAAMAEGGELVWIEKPKRFDYFEHELQIWRAEALK